VLIALLTVVVLATLAFGAAFLQSVLASRAGPKPEAVALGAVTNFFDTLGIGCFAPTMAWFKFRGLVPDRLIPGTMLVGHSLPTLVQAVIFLVLLGAGVDPVLLVGCAVAVGSGAVLGVPLVVKAPVRLIQAVVAVGLVVAAVLYALTNLELMPGGGTAASLPLTLLAAAIAANFVFGVLLNFGIGNYAPTLALLSLMGMDPRLCFPIMAGGGALAIAGAGIGHIRRGQIDLRIAAGLALGGVPAVLVAAFLVKEMPLELLRWLVVAVVLYAAFVMARSALVGQSSPAAATAG
jgi:uncharacterized membrane protein YfcA